MSRASLGHAILPLLLFAGCGDGGGDADAAAPFDLGIPDVGALLDGPPRLRGAFTVVGCSTLDTSTGQPRCSGRAPLGLTFVPLGSGVDTFVWTFSGGDPGTSKEVSPVVSFGTPGTYSVTLAAGGTAGTTTATGTVVVSAGVTASPCLDDTDCDAGAGLFCVCKPGELGCGGALAIGFCARTCSGSVCAAGELCADFTRGGAFVPSAGADGGAAGEVWRRALCVPACTAATQCRSGLSCRELPALPPGAVAGSAYSWQKGCFAAVGGDDGDACRSPNGLADPSRCLSGRCDDYGARGTCSSDCTTTADCPSTAACATFTGPPSAKACVRRCDATSPCKSDPLLNCEAADPMGGLGFSVAPAEPPSVQYCAPRRCSTTSQCAPSGSCVLVNGDRFCLRN
jgi:PKD repeat protein